MRIPTDRITEGDFRRAAAVLAHHAANDSDGVSAILDEAEIAGRLRQLVWTIPAVFGGLSADGEWHSERTAEVMRAAVHAFAEMECGS